MAASLARNALALAKDTVSITRGRIVLGMLLNILATMTEGISMALLIPLIGLLQVQNHPASLGFASRFFARFHPSLGALLATFIGLVILQGMFSRGRTIYIGRIVNIVSDTLRTRLFAAIALANWDVIQVQRVSDMNHLLTEEMDRIRLVFSSLLSIVQTAIVLAVYFAFALLVSWPMALVAVGIGIVLVVTVYPIRRQALEHGRHLTQIARQRASMQLEMLNGLRVVKSFVAERALLDRYVHHMAQVRRRTISFIKLSTAGGLFYQVGSAVAAAAFIWVAIEYLHLDLARLVILLLIFLRIAPRFAAMQQSMQQVSANMAAYENLLDRQKIYEDAAETEPPAGSPAFILRDTARFENVSLRYRGGTSLALDNIDCVIRAGRATALIGASGSGKSTLADLLMGLSRPTLGRILIDGQPLEAENRRMWRKAVAYVPQEPFLLHDTIRANFRIARPDATEADMLAALAKARAADFVANLPEGLDTVVGERGTRFSGGERQRISLARALITRPALLILDEATSALDWKTQKEISDIIATLKGETTVLSIAHRPSMIRFADDVLVMEQGKIIEAGPFAEMAARPGSHLARLLRGEDVTEFALHGNA